MKTLLFFVVLMLNCIFVSAQQRWEAQTIKADNLKGTKATTLYTFEKENGEYFCYDDDGSFFVVCRKYSMFNFRSEYNKLLEDLEYFVYATVGLYDSADNLINNIRLKMEIIQGSEDTAYSPDNADSRKIFKHLTEVNGYVRIIVPLFGVGDVDIKMPCNSQLYKDMNSKIKLNLQPLE